MGSGGGEMAVAVLVLHRVRCRPPGLRPPAAVPPPLPSCLQLRAQGWQLAPFMLSSTEKQRYLALRGA
jgi:hypothetical protein